MFVTNHAFHSNLGGVGESIQALAAGFRMDDFGSDVHYRGYAGIMAARYRHVPMTALIALMKTHYEIPATFDGELPSTLTLGVNPHRLRFGERYALPDADGNEQMGGFYNATVNRGTGEVYGAYELDDGRPVLAVTTLDAAELKEYQRYPDTFFGEALKPPGRADTFVDLGVLLFGSYQHTPREKLLEFMANAEDIEHLRALGQRDLAITYADRVAGAFQKKA